MGITNRLDGGNFCWNEASNRSIAVCHIENGLASDILIRQIQAGERVTAIFPTPLTSAVRSCEIFPHPPVSLRS